MRIQQKQKKRNKEDKIRDVRDNRDGLGTRTRYVFAMIFRVEERYEIYSSMLKIYAITVLVYSETARALLSPHPYHFDGGQPVWPKWVSTTRLVCHGVLVVVCRRRSTVIVIVHYWINLISIPALIRSTLVVGLRQLLTLRLRRAYTFFFIISCVSLSSFFKLNQNERFNKHINKQVFYRLTHRCRLGKFSLIAQPIFSF